MTERVRVAPAVPRREPLLLTARVQAPDSDVTTAGNLRRRALTRLPVDGDQAGPPPVMHPAVLRDHW